jgi:uncharacterized iron-regulated protein
MKARALAPLLLAAACAPRFDPRLVDVPIAGRPWVSTLGQTHPLAGRIWAPRAGRFVDEAALTAAVTSADFVVLGETHDNPDHHLLQARLLRAVVAAGRRPALAFEMLTTDQQATVDASLAQSPRDADALGRAVKWNESRWPDFTLYRPIFATGLAADLPVVAANLGRAQVKRIVAKGREGLDADLSVRLARDEPLPAATAAALREEMNEEHCGELPESMLDPMVLAQRARDARMAERMVTAGAERGAVLIAGSGHARDDRGVPAVVSRDAPGRKIVAVSFTEVEEGETDPAAYREDGRKDLPAPYDFLVFTPRTKRADPCEGMKAHMEKKRAAQPAAAEPGAATTTAR